MRLKIIATTDLKVRITIGNSAENNVLVVARFFISKP
jgi:hypothetical protein